MDKQELNKKTVSQLERLATKYGAKKVNPDGKKKTKAQLVNAVLMAYRLKGGKAAPSSKAPAPKAKGLKYVQLKNEYGTFIIWRNAKGIQGSAQGRFVASKLKDLKAAGYTKVSKADF